LAVRCIQRNVRKFMVVRDWPWWRLLVRVTPLLNVHRTEEELRTKSVGFSCSVGSGFCHVLPREFPWTFDFFYFILGGTGIIESESRKIGSGKASIETRERSIGIKGKKIIKFFILSAIICKKPPISHILSLLNSLCM